MKGFHRMKNHLIEKKDIYNIVYYSQQEINVEKLFDQLYGMITYRLISPGMKLAFLLYIILHSV